MMRARMTTHKSRDMPVAATNARKQMQQPESNDIAAPLDFEVERIVAHDTSTGSLRYLVKWKGYTTTENTWEPERNLDCEELLEAYWSQPKKQALRQTAAKAVFHSKQSGGGANKVIQKKRGRPPGSKKTVRSPPRHHVADSTTAERDEDRRVRSVSKSASGRSSGTGGHGGRHQGKERSHSKRNTEEMYAFEAGEISSLVLYEGNDQREFTGIISPQNPEEELMIPVHMVYKGEWKADKSRVSRSRSANGPIPVVPIEKSKKARIDQVLHSTSPEPTD